MRFVGFAPAFFRAEGVPLAHVGYALRPSAVLLGVAPEAVEQFFDLIEFFFGVDIFGIAVHIAEAGAQVLFEGKDVFAAHFFLGDADVSAGIVIDFAQVRIDAADLILNILLVFLQLGFEGENAADGALLEQIPEALFVAGNVVFHQAGVQVAEFRDGAGVGVHLQRFLGEAAFEFLHLQADAALQLAGLVIALL